MATPKRGSRASWKKSAAGGVCAGAGSARGPGSTCSREFDPDRLVPQRRYGKRFESQGPFRGGESTEEH